MNPDDGREGDGAATPDMQHVRVRRAAAPEPLFGQTPIAGPRAAPAPPEAEPEAEEETAPEIAVWIRRAAVVAALRTGAQAGLTGVFMGLCLGCFLSGLLPDGGAMFLGMLVMIISIPVGILAGIGTYRQTIESERTRQGLCPRCGYDLRGINTERCPECGNKVRLRPAWLRQPETPGDDEESD